MAIIGWIKDKLDAYLSPDPSLSFHDEEPEEEEEEEDRSEPVVALRFKVTVKGDDGKADRILFVYARDMNEARGPLALSGLPVALLNTMIIEPAGHVDNGVVHFPPEELRAVMASMQDGRRTPGA